METNPYFRNKWKKQNFPFVVHFHSVSWILENLFWPTFWKWFCKTAKKTNKSMQKPYNGLRKFEHLLAAEQNFWEVIPPLCTWPLQMEKWCWVSKSMTFFKVYEAQLKHTLFKMIVVLHFECFHLNSTSSKTPIVIPVTSWKIPGWCQIRMVG